MLGAARHRLSGSLEAGLIIGIVLAATRGVARPRRLVAAGVVAGMAGAGVIALFAERSPMRSRARARNYSMPWCSAPRC